MKKHVPNLLTLMNLSAGLFAILFAVVGDLKFAVYCIMAGILFDFFDGFVARLLNVQGELGKQLDSLADVVTSGVAPGMIWFVLLSRGFDYNFFESQEFIPWPFIAFLCPLASAYRLAKFNIDTRQTDSFIGLPTPANALLIGGMVFMPFELSLALVYAVGIFGCIILNAEIPLFSLKFKNYSWKDNKWTFVFLIFVTALVVILGIASMSWIILLYVLWSILKNKFT
ncbi:MAG: CDP-diacylglycerol--serine O-phosphatidyltransferase [Flavobacteriaceae bacterium]